MLAAVTTLLAFVRLGRPHFLAGGFLLHGLGVAMALSTGVELSLPSLIWGQLAITATQWMTHYANEAFDLDADRANPNPTAWAGGSRVLVAGQLQPRTALTAARLLAAIALAAGLALVVIANSGPLTLPLIGLALILAWSYSAPPAQLHSRGLGELTMAVVVPGLTPLVGFYLQAGRLAALPFLAVAPLCCLQLAMSFAIEFPDAAGDAAAGKRTLVVRLGGHASSRLLVAALAAAYLLLPLLVLLGLPGPVAIAPLLLLPLATWQARRVARGAWSDPNRWDSLAFWSIGLVMGSAALEALAFLALALRLTS